MSATPWWSSPQDGLDPDQDPLLAHLSARGLVDDEVDQRSSATSVAGDDADQATNSDGPDVDGHEPGDRPETGPSTDDPPAGPPHPDGICGICPICRGHAVLQERHPEVATHLAYAARSLSLALARFADLVDVDQSNARSETSDASATSDTAGRADPDVFRPILLDDESDVS